MVMLGLGRKKYVLYRDFFSIWPVKKSAILWWILLYKAEKFSIVLKIGWHFFVVTFDMAYPLIVKDSCENVR